MKRPSSLHRWSTAGLALLLVVFVVTVLSVHFLAFAQLRHVLKRHFEAEILQQARTLRASLGGPSADLVEKTMRGPGGTWAPVAVLLGVSFPTPQELMEAPYLPPEPRGRVIAGHEVVWWDGESDTVRCYLPLPDQRILEAAFHAPHIPRLNAALTRLSLFEGAALLTAVFLALAVYLWYGSPFRRMLGLAESHSSASLNPPDNVDQRAYLVRTFEGALAELKRRAESTERMSDAIARSVSSAVLAFNTNGRVIRSNPAAAAILDLPESQLPDRHYENLLTGKLRILVANALEAQKAGVLEADIARPGSPHKRVVAASVSPMLDPEGRFAGALCILTDLTRIKELEDHLRSKENLARLGEMTAGIAHEFRNSLAGIIGFAQLMEKQCTDERLLEYAREILREARYTEQVVGDFLRFARPVDLEKQTVNLTLLLEEVSREQGSGSVEFERPESPAYVAGDPILLKQAFSNILRNALEALTGLSTYSVHVVLSLRGDKVEVRIRDNGRGMDAETLRKATLPFFTTKESGSGLGLALVHKIVLAHDGELFLESSPGTGTAVTVLLPNMRGEGDGT